MKAFRIAIFGCGAIGGGAAKVLLENQKEFSERAGANLVLSAIVSPHPRKAAEKYGIPLELFRGGGKDLSKAESAACIDEVIRSADVDLVVEAIGGSNDFTLGLVTGALEAGKHVVTANKALLAEHGKLVFETAERCGKGLGFETSVCTSIPIIKAMKESFVSDEILSISGIMNGTSNYVLTKMAGENLSFAEALKLAQEAGYAEADPALDVGGGDAAHKLSILVSLAFGLDGAIATLDVHGISDVTKEDILAADEIDCAIKLVCFAGKRDGAVYATVRPMMVKHANLLSRIEGTTNAVRVQGKYTGENLLIGKGAGSMEGGSAIASDIVFLARYGSLLASDDRVRHAPPRTGLELKNLDDLSFPYNLVFDTADVPGITGAVTTAIGNQGINIDTVGHNRHGLSTAVFSVATMPCTLAQVKRAIAEIRERRPDILKAEPKVMPILF